MDNDAKSAGFGISIFEIKSDSSNKPGIPTQVAKQILVRLTDTAIRRRGTHGP